MTSRLLLASVAGIAALTAPAVAFEPSVAVGSSQYAVNLVGYVPVICRASVDASTIAPTAGTVQLGSLREFCNSPNGYRVHADYSASLANATLIVDGVPVPLGTNGSALISGADSARIANHSLSLELPEAVDGGSISFRIEPL